jgi:hypothetical protein
MPGLVATKRANAKLHAQNLRAFKADLKACDKFCETDLPFSVGIENVKTVQRFAGEIGVKLTVDGIPGTLTTRFIRTFQSAYALGPYWDDPLEVTGVADSATLIAIEHCRLNDYHVTTDFRWPEYATKNTNKRVTRNNPVIMLDRELAVGMQLMRTHYGRAIRIISAFRDSFWNSIVGGAKSSQHLLGKAADFHLLGPGPIPTEPVCKRWFNGIGVARLSGRVSHVDVRSWVARWFYNGS